MRNKILATMIGLVAASTALAQTGLNRSQEREAIEVITGVGGECERVVRTQTIGEVDGGMTLMAVACSDGDHAWYVLALNRRGDMSFYATCENLARGTDNQIRCFA